MKKFKNLLKGERIVLKLNKPTIQMANIIFEEVSKNRKHLDPWMPWSAFTLKVEDSMKYLFKSHEEMEQKQKANYGIYVEGEYIGNIGIFDINKNNNSAEIGYWLSADYARKGYVSEAVKVLEKDFFDNHQINRIQIKCDERNIPSIGVAKKCGYVLEGKLREDSFCAHSKLFRNTLIFSKLKSEYKRKKSR